MNQRGLVIALMISLFLTAGLVASARWQASEPCPCSSEIILDSKNEEVDQALHDYRTQPPRDWRSCMMQQ